MPEGRYWLQTLGCPKNQVDSDKLAGLLDADGYVPASDPSEAELVVVNTCAFIEAARQESIDTVLELADVKAPGGRLVVTGCMAERYGDELAEALPEVDLVAGFGRSFTSPPVAIAPVVLRPRRPAGPAPSAERAPSAEGPPSAAVSSFDLLSLPRPPSRVPWAYVKVAEGCDRRCGFCAIPSFRGAQRSRPPADVLHEIETLVSAPGMPVHEVVLVAQDLASYGRDRTARRHDHGIGHGAPTAAARRPTPLVDLVTAVRQMVPRTRLLYLYPSGLQDELVDAILSTGVPYFDLSLQHVSRPHLARMRRWGDGERFLARIEAIRRVAPEATFRSSFIVGYPGETEDDQDALLEFLAAAHLDWAGFFSFSREDGTFADTLSDQVPDALVLERLRECTELQDAITAQRRDLLVGEVRQVLVDSPGLGRTVHE
ncbi:MAG: MiaB/RimO family radical SAM methylthiotransferase, partial [Acidimicrobiales bacterium]